MDKCKNCGHEIIADTYSQCINIDGRVIHANYYHKCSCTNSSNFHKKCDHCDCDIPQIKLFEDVNAIDGGMMG